MESNTGNWARIPPTPQALEEALELSLVILADVELNRTTLSSIALKTSRLWRLLNEFDAQFLFGYEAAGYPVSNGVVPEYAWKTGLTAGRGFDSKDPKTGVVIFVESIEQLEEQIVTAKLGLEVSADRDVSISSANPYQRVTPPTSNYLERVGHQMTISKARRAIFSQDVVD